MVEAQLVQADLAAANAAVTLSLGGMGGAGIQIEGTFSGTLTFYGSVDGVTQHAVLASPVGSTTQVSTATAAGMWTVNTVGFATLKVQMTTYSSGSAAVSLRGVVVSPVR